MTMGGGLHDSVSLLLNYIMNFNCACVIKEPFMYECSPPQSRSQSPHYPCPVEQEFGLFSYQLVNVVSFQITDVTLLTF